MTHEVVVSTAVGEFWAQPTRKMTDEGFMLYAVPGREPMTVPEMRQLGYRVRRPWPRERRSPLWAA